MTEPTLTVYGDLAQLVGWLLFNFGDLRPARYYYDDARKHCGMAWLERAASLTGHTLSGRISFETASGTARMSGSRCHPCHRPWA